MITYFLQTSLCWIFFLLVYKLFLKKETFFVNNRWYLLVTLVIGLLFPFARDLWDSNSNAPISYVMPLQGGAQIFELRQLEVKQGMDYFQIMHTVFWIGFILSLSKFIKDIYSLLSQIKRYPHTKYKSYTEIKTDYEHLPFSFFNFVFISDQLKFKDPEWNRILTHEICHVHGWHSLDILFVESLSTVFWWNPLIYWYKKNIRDTHEYIADAQVLKSTDTESYGSLLVGSAQSGLQMSLANHFIYSQLKNRIDMMLKDKSKKSMIWKYALILPAVVFLAVLFAYKTPEKEINEVDEVILTQDTLPTNILYILNGVKVKAEDVTKIDPKQIEKINVLKDKSAIEKYGPESMEGVIEVFTKIPPVLYVINGIVISESAVNSLRKETIKSVNVLKGESAVAKYDQRGSAGAVEITANAIFRFMLDGVPTNPIDTKSWTLNSAKVIHGKDEAPDLIELYFQSKIAKSSMAEEYSKLNDTPREIFKVVEESPRFPGCENLASLEEKNKCAAEKMLQYLYQNIRYPLQAKNENIQGRVVISFVIEKDGRITEAEVVRDLGGGCGAEALRVINLMNSMPEKWIPGKQGGKSVAVQYNLPIAFRLSGNSLSNIPPLPSANSSDEKESTTATNQFILKSKNGDEIYKMVEESPRFPGCENLTTLEEKNKCATEKMLQFFYKNILYPKEAKEKGIQGRVVIGFIIEPDGTIGESTIVREIGGGCGAEALRVINLMNAMDEKWIPGKQRGKSVAVQYNIPIAFTLEKDSAPVIQKTKEEEKSKILVTAAEPTGNQKREWIKSSDNKLSLVPNPASKKVDILYKQGKNVKMEIFDLSGRIVQQGGWENFSGRQTIDISTLVRGTYMVRVREGNIVSEQKMVVQ